MFNSIDKIKFHYDYIKEDEIENKKVQTIMIEIDNKNGNFLDKDNNVYTNFVVLFDETIMTIINKLNPVGISVTSLLPISVTINVHFQQCVDVSDVMDYLQTRL